MVNPEDTVNAYMDTLQDRTGKQKEGDKVFLRTRLHGQPLNRAPQQKLVVITTVHTFSQAKMLAYPYHCPGPEDSPSSLKDLYIAGMYV